MIYSFAVQDAEGEPHRSRTRGAALAETLLAVRAGDVSNDSLNALVLAAGLRWREVDVLRAYANYAFQVGAVPARFAAAARAAASTRDRAPRCSTCSRREFDPERAATPRSDRPRREPRAAIADRARGRHAAGRRPRAAPHARR